MHYMIYSALCAFSLNVKILNFCHNIFFISLVLYFGLRPGQKCHSKVMHRKEMTHSNGSYERKWRGRKSADEMGRGKIFPWYTHRLMHWKRVTCELHESYFRLMTIKHAIPKLIATLNTGIAPNYGRPIVGDSNTPTVSSTEG